VAAAKVAAVAGSAAAAVGLAAADWVVAVAGAADWEAVDSAEARLVEAAVG